MIKYLKKEGDNIIENELPVTFGLTQFHIIFMYAKNITVLSKISNEIVYFKNFEAQTLSGIQIDFTYNRALLYSSKEPVFTANLKGEDQDAWKYYLKRGAIKDALTNCKTSKQRSYVSGIYAE